MRSCAKTSNRSSCNPDTAEWPRFRKRANLRPGGCFEKIVNLVRRIYKCMNIIALVCVIQYAYSKQEVGVIGEWIWSVRIPHILNPPSKLYADPKLNDISHLKVSGSETVTLKLYLSPDHRFVFKPFKYLGSWSFRNGTLILKPDYHCGLDFLNGDVISRTNGIPDLYFEFSEKDRALHWHTGRRKFNTRFDRVFRKKNTDR